MKKIVAIDDEISIRFILESTLKSQYEIITFENGKEALEYLQKGNLPDLIICDLQMPEINGYDLTKQIRSSGFFDDIPIIILSGIEESSEKIKCFEMGADDYVVKPFNPKEIEARIKRRISMREHFLNRIGH